MRRRHLGAGMAAFGATMVAFATPAFAHVTVDPASAPKGAEITLGFRVPSEEPNADTVKIQIFFPTNTPILGIDPEPIRGWEDTTVTQHLTSPVQTDDGPVNSVVSEVQWSGGPIPPGNFVEFYVLAQTLPSNTNQLVFKALQTYSNGDIVRWIDPVTAANPDPPHPTPILNLSAPTAVPAQTVAPQTPVTVNTSRYATISSVNSAKTEGAVGIVVGIVGLLIAAAALVFTRRRRRASPGVMLGGRSVTREDGVETPEDRAVESQLDRS